MNIIFSSDNNYSPYLTVSIFSILESNIDENINFYILDLGIERDSRIFIKNIIEEHNCNVSFILVDENDFTQFPKTIEYISYATYARLNLSNYLPNIDKAIYIDVDTLTNGELKELWDIDISNYDLAACQDTFIDIENSSYKLDIELEDNTYFNAGVLLINLKRWRSRNVLEESISWLKKYRRIIKYQDQDILNGIFKDKVKIINNRFNFTPSERHLIKNGYQSKVETPIVIYHYCGGTKFWHENCDHTSSYLGYHLFRKIKKNHKLPESWDKNLFKISFLKKLNKVKKNLKDKLKYRIY